MLNLIKPQEFSCLTSYTLEAITSINVQHLSQFFEHLPPDPYLEGNYRFRRLSHFQVVDDRLVTLPHRRLFQSKAYNPLLGDVAREYAELEDGLIQSEDFQKVIWEFFQFCQLCTKHKEIGVHQIRTTASSQKIGNPAPEGIHRDGVDLVGIFSVNRQGISGGETHLYKSKKEKPVFTKILNPGELLVFSDHQYFHYTSPVTTTDADEGVRDVFVLTCPGLFPPEAS